MMSFDGIFLSKLLLELNFLKSGRIVKITDSGDTDFIFTIRVQHQNHNLMLSFSSHYARLHITNKNYDVPKTPKSFTMFLRKHLEGYFIEDLTQYQSDRIVTFKLAGYSEMKDYTYKYLICEIMGRYANLILTDEKMKILEVLKKTGITEYGRTLLPNAIYEYPHTEKLNPFDRPAIKANSPKELINELNGISLLLAQDAFKTEAVEQNFYQAINAKIEPVVIKDCFDKLDFYYNPLSYEVVSKAPDLSTLIDDFYYAADLEAKIKIKTNDIESVISRNYKRLSKKLKNLNQELLTALDCDEYKIKGELLLTYSQPKAKTDKVEIFNYYTNQMQTIALDSRYDVITNSQRYFKKYQKTKAAINHIKEQIALTSREIDYFAILKSQLKNCNINDALEIKAELIENKYIFEQKKLPHKKSKPSYLTYIVDDFWISVGKNNLQNEYITHKLAKPSDWWFHIKDGSGSHVVVHTDKPNEKLIRTAALLAAYYSDFQNSSSVAVDFTQIKNLKKIPGQKACFVTYTHQKTIYIDPDENLIKELKIKK